MTSRGCRRHGMKGRCRVGTEVQPSRMSLSTACAAAAACSTRPGWWNVRTASSSHSDLTSTPPSPTCAT
eukprot:2506044-Pleurochrysis_carterae.AAC.1